MSTCTVEGKPATAGMSEIVEMPKTILASAVTPTAQNERQEFSREITKKSSERRKIREERHEKSKNSPFLVRYISVNPIANGLSEVQCFTKKIVLLDYRLSCCFGMCRTQEIMEKI